MEKWAKFYAAGGMPWDSGAALSQLVALVETDTWRQLERDTHAPLRALGFGYAGALAPCCCASCVYATG